MVFLELSLFHFLSMSPCVEGKFSSLLKADIWKSNGYAHKRWALPSVTHLWDFPLGLLRNLTNERTLPISSQRTPL